MNLLCLRSETTKLWPEYAKYLIRSPVFRSQLSKSIKKAVNQASVSIRDLNSISVALPTLPEQRRVADILNQADALRTKRRAALARLDEMARAVFMEMFGVPTNLPHVKLGEGGTEFRYGTSNKSSAEGYPTLRIPNIVAGGVDLSNLKSVKVDQKDYERLRLRSGDLLFVRTNGNPNYVGRCAVVLDDVGCKLYLSPDKFIYASYLIRARLSKKLFDPIFVQSYLSMNEGRTQLTEASKTSAGQFNINTEALAALKIPLMPVSEQQAFAEKIKAVSLINEKQKMHLSDLDALFASLQHRAFRGEL